MGVLEDAVLAAQMGVLMLALVVPDALDHAEDYALETVVTNVLQHVFRIVPMRAQDLVQEDVQAV